MTYRFNNKNLLTLLFFFVFFQNAFVLSLGGGTIKWYELIGLFVTFTLLVCKKRLSFDKCLLSLFILMVVSPIVSDVFFLIYARSTNLSVYYTRFPEARFSIRSNPIFANIYNYVLSLGCFSIIYLVKKSKYIYLNYFKIVRIFLISASIVSLYTIYQFIGTGILHLPDLIPSFLDHRNYRSGQLRGGGFSIEPGSYVVLQSIVVCYFLFHERLFSLKINKLLIIINVLALLFTTSSNLLVPFFVISIGYMMYGKNKKLKLFYIMFCFLLILLLIYLNGILDNKLYYIFVLKVKNFILGTNDTLDSGAMRSLTNRIGIKIFFQNPLFGCGFGDSNYFLCDYEYKMGIEIWGERFTMYSTPQNNISKILAEQGLLGIFSFISFFYYYLKKLYGNKSINVITYKLIFLEVILFNCFAGVFVTNIFIWLNLALGLNYLTYSKENFIIENEYI